LSSLAIILRHDQSTFSLSRSVRRDLLGLDDARQGRRRALLDLAVRPSKWRDSTTLHKRSSRMVPHGCVTALLVRAVTATARKMSGMAPIPASDYAVFTRKVAEARGRCVLDGRILAKRSHGQLPRIRHNVSAIGAVVPKEKQRPGAAAAPGAPLQEDIVRRKLVPRRSWSGSKQKNRKKEGDDLTGCENSRMRQGKDPLSETLQNGLHSTYERSTDIREYILTVEVCPCRGRNCVRTYMSVSTCSEFDRRWFTIAGPHENFQAATRPTWPSIYGTPKALSGCPAP
jgi:hypothetical protein